MRRSEEEEIQRSILAHLQVFVFAVALLLLLTVVLCPP